LKPGRLFTNLIVVILALPILIDCCPLLAQPGALHCKGRWVLDQQGRPVAPPVPQGRMQGLQSSGLDYDGKSLWTVGDQRSNFPGYLLRIDPESARLAGDPIKLEVTSQTKGVIPERLSTGNPDLEGLCLKRGDPLLFYIVVENDGNYILESHYRTGDTTAAVLRVLSARFPSPPVGGDSNARFEGIDADGDTLYVAYEKDGAGRPHVYRGSLSANSTEVELTDLPVPFLRVPPRPGKGGINVNALKLLRGKAPTLIMVARDQERLLLYELATAKLSYVDLEFRDADDREIYWTSPEGIALDPHGDRLWVITDPDSLRGNYRRRDEANASGNYAAMVPLLFEIRLSQVLASRIPVDDAEADSQQK
jgi:DNA-binding beta-propeller fold protein YncE